MFYNFLVFNDMGLKMGVFLALAILTNCSWLVKHRSSTQACERPPADTVYTADTKNTKAYLLQFLNVSILDFLMRFRKRMLSLHILYLDFNLFSFWC